MNKRGVMDLTQGRPMKQIILFSLPLIMGTLFQQLYSFADTVMVGRLIGENALAAVGTTYSLDYITLGFVQGTCVGFGIPLAQAVGAGDRESFQRYFWNGVWLCLGLSVVSVVLTVTLAIPMLRMINTPEEIIGDAAVYIRIVFLGMPASILYNFCAGVLRASGDSQRPTEFLMFTSVLNIALDYLLIAVIPMGVAGAAVATVLSKLVSGLLNLGWIVWKTDLLHGSAGLRSPSRHHIGRLCKLGFPMGFEISVSGIGAVMLQGAINSLGTAAIAGQTAGEKIRRMFTLPMESVGMGMATYAGQNVGAQRYDRVREGIAAALTINGVYCAAAWVAIFFGKDAFAALVLGAEDGAAAVLCVQYLTVISTLFFFHGGVQIMRNILQGMGYSIHAVLSGVGELVGRGVMGWLSVRYLGYMGICIANPVAWAVAFAYCGGLVAYFLRKRMSGEY